MPSLQRSNQLNRDFETYIDALFKTGDDAQVYKTLSELDVPKPYRVRIKVVYSAISPLSVIKESFEFDRVQSLSEESNTYVYTTTIGRKIVRDIRLPFFISSFYDSEISSRVQAVIAVCRTDQWGAFSRYLKDCYPQLVPILLSQSELINGAKALKRVTGHEVHVRTFSAKESRRGGTQELSKSIREWTYEELDQVLLDIQDRNQIITSLELDFIPKVGAYSHVLPKATCKIRKDGEIDVTGNFTLAFDAVATQFAKVGEKKLEFFRGRGLRESRYTPNPLAINFVNSVFDNLKTVKKFIEVITKYPHSMYAVAHGNPYAQVKITDLFDGSSFDVWAIPPKRIALIPGLKASEASLERLVHYIFDKFQEGPVENYGREERPFEGIE